ncbi:hypothetical protein C8R46DRAFT_890696, partial [Mycena filopes]
LSSANLSSTSRLFGAGEARHVVVPRAPTQTRNAEQKIISERDVEENRITVFEEILAKPRENHLALGQLMLYVFDPIYKQGSARWSFFQEGGMAARVLNLWVSNKNSATARQEVGPWAEDYVAGRVHAEAQAVTASKILQTQGVRVDNDYVTGFRMTEVGARIASFARVTTRLLNAFATSARNLKTNLPHRKAIDGTYLVVTSAALALLGEFSHKNNYSRRIMGLYLYATGAQRQTITVLAHLGISESYQNLTHKPRTNTRRRRRRVLGDYCPPTPPPTPTLHELSSSMRGFARVTASTGLFAAAYDNVEMVFRAAEQILGRTGTISMPGQRLSLIPYLVDSQENGTCATIFGQRLSLIPPYLVDSQENENNPRTL